MTRRGATVGVVALMGIVLLAISVGSRGSGSEPVEGGDQPTPRATSTSRRVGTVVGLSVVAVLGVGLIISSLGPGGVAPGTVIVDDEPAPLPVAGGFSSAADAVADPADLPSASASPDPDDQAETSGDDTSADDTSANAAAAESQRPQAPSYDRADHLWIPSLDVDAPVVTEDVVDGELTIPGDPGTVGRWQGSAPVAADIGTTLVAGHVSVGNLGAGALYTLYTIEPGALVVVTDPSGRPTAWRVTSLQVHPKDELPPVLFDPDGRRRLALVTCGGELTMTPDGRHTYKQNVVALAEPVAMPA